MEFAIGVLMGLGVVISAGIDIEEADTRECMSELVRPTSHIRGDIQVCSIN